MDAVWQGKSNGMRQAVGFGDRLTGRGNCRGECGNGEFPALLCGSA